MTTLSKYRRKSFRSFLGEFPGVAVERGEEGPVLGAHALHGVLVERLTAQSAHGDCALVEGGDHV
nr:hypothetical protein [Streptomyces oryzae]